MLVFSLLFILVFSSLPFIIFSQLVFHQELSFSFFLYCLVVLFIFLGVRFYLLWFLKAKRKSTLFSNDFTKNICFKFNIKSLSIYETENFPNEFILLKSPKGKLSIVFGTSLIKKLTQEELNELLVLACFKLKTESILMRMLIAHIIFLQFLPLFFIEKKWHAIFKKSFSGENLFLKIFFMSYKNLIPEPMFNYSEKELDYLEKIHCSKSTILSALEKIKEFKTNKHLITLEAVKPCSVFGEKTDLYIPLFNNGPI